MDPRDSFDDLDPDLLARHSLAVYRDRLILRAQPPIPDEALQRVEHVAGARVPPSLLACWQVAFGGALDYDLAVLLDGGRPHRASLTELFYPGSKHYRDLFGWMDEEGLQGPEHLAALPFGGFEYLERVYTMLGPEREGEVLLYVSGIPWPMRINEDTVATIAPSVAAIFDQLTLDEDPFAPDTEAATGLEMADAIDALRPAEPALVDRLRDLVRHVVFDWRARVATPFRNRDQDHRAARLAMECALGNDDAALLDQLAQNRWPLDLVLRASSGGLALALAYGAHAVAHRLLDLGAVRLTDPVVSISSPQSAPIERCIAAGVPFDPWSAISLAQSGHVDLAMIVVTRAERAGDWSTLVDRVTQSADAAERSAARVRNGSMASNRTAKEYDEDAARLRDFAARCSARL